MKAEEGGIFQVGTLPLRAGSRNHDIPQSKTPPRGGGFSAMKRKRTNETPPRTCDSVSARARRHPHPAATEGAQRRKGI